MSEDFNLADFLPYRLAQISERVSKRLAVEYGRSHGLSVAEWRVLTNLRHLGTASVRDIQLVTNLEKSRVSRAVSRLEKAEMVAKQTSAKDARLVEIALTPNGIKTLEAIIPKAKAIENRLLTGLSAPEREGLFAAFEHLHKVLDADPEAKARFHRED